MHPHRGFLQGFFLQQALRTAGTLNIALVLFALVCAAILLFGR
jgi:hypothetical protein